MMAMGTLFLDLSPAYSIHNSINNTTAKIIVLTMLMSIILSVLFH